jgi:branched-chain amino acid transport system permease protein
MGLKALPIALLAGLESITGAMLAGLIMGIGETVAAGYMDPYIGGGTSDVFSYILMMIILLFKPYGLFGLRKIERI